MGHRLSDNQLNDVFGRFKDLADRKKTVYDEDIEALVDENIATAHDRVRLVSLTVIAGTRGPQRPPCGSTSTAGAATEEADGNGPSTPCSTLSRRWCRTKATLELYQVHAVTEGTDAQADVSVRLGADGRSYTARARTRTRWSRPPRPISRL
jgi:2-isopropylmalate synthase